MDRHASGWVGFAAAVSTMTMRLSLGSVCCFRLIPDRRRVVAFRWDRVDDGSEPDFFPINGAQPFGAECTSWLLSDRGPGVGHSRPAYVQQQRLIRLPSVATWEPSP